MNQQIKIIYFIFYKIDDFFVHSGPKVGIQYIVYKHILLYSYFWPTLYNGPHPRPVILNKLMDCQEI
jgi:hypothetical protein